MPNWSRPPASSRRNRSRRAMAEVRQVFDDSAGYERFMGRWSRAVGEIFLDWIGAASAPQWLDVGCGTGIFTELILKRSVPAAARDRNRSLAGPGRRRAATLASDRTSFRMADAQALPFADASFDVVASALVVNFIPDRSKALREMRRVVRPSRTGRGLRLGFRRQCESERAFAGRHEPRRRCGARSAGNRRLRPKRGCDRCLTGRIVRHRHAGLSR